MTVPNSLINMNGNMLCSVDVETTGRVAGFHEVIQVGVIPLNGEIEPCEDHSPFYINIAPLHPERAEKSAAAVHGLDIDELLKNGVSPWRAADLFDEWVTGLDLPFSKKLVPLAHNWGFERGFLTNWLGQDTFDALWFYHPRDTMILAATINDAASFHGKKIPFGTLSLSSMCKKFSIDVVNSHDALADALVGARLYREMILAFGRH